MKSTYKFFTLALILTLGACDSLLDIEPRQSVDSSKALTTQEGISAGLANVYSYLKTTVMYGRDFVATSEALSDNSRIINRAGGRYQNQGNNVAFNHLGNWDFAYAAINDINLLLEALPNANITSTYRTEVEGQAKGLRALFYFDLMRAYAYEPNMAPAGTDLGGVPIQLTGILYPDQIELKPRSSIAEVYALIYSDLTEAMAKCPTTGIPAYMTKVAATAIFSKVALYNQDFAKAEQLATDAITTFTAPGTGRGLTSNSNYISHWRVSSHPESVFEIAFRNANESIGVNESVQSAFTTRVGLTSTTLGGYGAVVPTTAFLALFSANDVRRSLYENGVSRSNSIVIECTKFLGKTGTVYMDNIPVIRLSELYLIRAEARARQNNNDVGALSDLNAITTRAGLPAYVALTGNALLNAIYAQRRLELAYEGDRWFDLKRRGVDVVKTTGNVPFSDYRILANIPVREIQSNPNLAQNPGY